MAAKKKIAKKTPRKKAPAAKSPAKKPSGMAPSPKGGYAKIVAQLRAFALSLPQTREDFPWGHSAFKVGAKAFCFMSAEDGTLSLSVKLPESASFALMQPYAQPTGYGLGKSGWVTARFDRPKGIPLELLRLWLTESYRAIAPKKLAASV